jgi:hypothetical protein
MPTWTSSAAAFPQLLVKPWTFLQAGDLSRRCWALSQQQRQQLLAQLELVAVFSEGSVVWGEEAKRMQGFRQEATLQD